MLIRFASTKLERTVNSAKELARAFGPKMARRIQIGMAVLSSAGDLGMVPKGGSIRCHQLRQDRDEQFAIDLIHPHRLVFRVDQEPIPRTRDGGIDLTKVTQIVITEIVDYHR